MDPHIKSEIHQIEMVQHTAARYTANRFHNTSSVNDMLTDLNWPTLQQRHLRTRPIFFTKLFITLSLSIPSKSSYSKGHELAIPIHSESSTFTLKKTLIYNLPPHHHPMEQSPPPNITICHNIQRTRKYACSSVHILLIPRYCVNSFKTLFFLLSTWCWIFRFVFKFSVHWHFASSVFLFWIVHLPLLHGASIRYIIVSLDCVPLSIRRRK
jgi:hypothetical protein